MDWHLQNMSLATLIYSDAYDIAHNYEYRELHIRIMDLF